ncbi:MAG: amidohydrolase [Candidatus Marinimicrobia bacterium]|nr:amidohydrolase [Candidatus Neomarinimicrobiota bacterium]
MKKKYFLLCINIILTLTGCESKHADMVIHNGTIYTMSDYNPIAETVIVKDGKIMNVGNQINYRSYIGEKTKILDLNGATMIPGFIEGHGHFMGLGYAKMRLDLSVVDSYDELVDMVAEAVEKAPPGEWILGRGWHQSKWLPTPSPLVKGFQTHDKLSAVSPNNPVWLTHASGHAGFANAKAMEIGGITAETEFGFGGEIIKNLRNQPTGIFNERAQNLISKHVESPSYDAGSKSDSDTDQQNSSLALELAVKECLENGITSFHDAGAGKESIQTFRDGINSNKLKIRLYVMLTSRDPKLLEEWYKNGPEIGTGNDYLTIRSIKLNADGALGSRGAWLLNEYTDRPGHFGMATQSIDYVYEVSKNGLKHGFQVNAHAIGDRANREILNQYQKVFNEYPEKANDLRWRIEHAQHIDPEDIPRFGELGVIPSIQGIHMSSDRPWAINRLGRKRIVESAYVWRDLIDHGAVIVNGTDVPVEPIDPLASFYASVTRKTLKGVPNNGYEPKQKMTRLEALKSYTINAAYAAFEEKIKGSIEIGKYADFTVLSKNIITIPENQLLNTKVLYTIINGKIEYKN